jgi:hypothetical protein
MGQRKHAWPTATAGPPTEAAEAGSSVCILRPLPHLWQQMVTPSIA